MCKRTACFKWTEDMAGLIRESNFARHLARDDNLVVRPNVQIFVDTEIGRANTVSTINTLIHLTIREREREKTSSHSSPTNSSNLLG